MGGHPIRGPTGHKTWPLVIYYYAINDLIIPGTDMWKYVDDSTISETVTKSEVSKVQQAVDELATQASADKFQLNETKCKELRITFSHSRKNFDPIKVNGQDLACLEQAKILGLQISCDLTWNNHVSEVVKKVKKRLACRAARLSNRFCHSNFSSIATGGLLFTGVLLTV